MTHAVPPATRIGRLLTWSELQDASDVHVRAGAQPVVRVHGRLTPVPSEVVAAIPDDITLAAWFLEAFPPEFAGRVAVHREVDASFTHGSLRYRANFSKQRGGQSFSFRTVPSQTQTLEELELPESLSDLLSQPRGIVLVTGPTGQGKSTSVRALLQHLNLNQAMRVITVEDPIEFVFTDARSHFEQREVGIDTASFADGIRNAMRQDPNVIFIGEIRDRDSIWAAMQAAETGHLVITTLHADSVPQAIGRILEFYPAGEQSSVSALLARNLHAIICQRLVPNLRGTRTPCLELLRRDAGVSDAIRSNDLHLLAGIVESSNHVGMHSFDQYLQELLAAELIDIDIARHHAVNRHKLELALRGIETVRPILKR